MMQPPSGQCYGVGARKNRRLKLQLSLSNYVLLWLIITIFIKKIKKNSDEIDVTKEGCNVKGNIFLKFCIFSCWTKGRIPVLSWIRRLTGAYTTLRCVNTGPSARGFKLQVKPWHCLFTTQVGNFHIYWNKSVEIFWYMYSIYVNYYENSPSSI